MVKFSLEIKANLENVNNLRPVGSDFRWYMKIKCCGCGETPDHWQYVSLEERQDIQGSRGTAHLVEKCKFCSRQNQLEIDEASISSYKIDKNRQFQHIISFECRGLEPVAFDPRIGWVAEGAESGTVFDEISLSEGDWCDYDEKASETVGIYEFESRFVRQHK